MTAADVNVTEKVAREAARRFQADRSRPDTVDRDRSVFAEGASFALAALRSPEVVAGIAGVLRDADDDWVRLHADAPQGHPPTRSHWQARAVVEWITGGAR